MKDFKCGKIHQEIDSDFRILQNSSKSKINQLDFSILKISVSLGNSNLSIIIWNKDMFQHSINTITLITVKSNYSRHGCPDRSVRHLNRSVAKKFPYKDSWDKIFRPVRSVRTTMFLETKFHSSQFITVSERTSQETIAAVFC